jgi:hypothetical protein
MLAVFCLRLACGLTAALLLLSPAQVNPRFFRVHFLTALGLAAVAAMSLREHADSALALALAGALGLTFLGSVVWLLDGAPGGQTLIFLAAATLTASLWLAEVSAGDARWRFVDDLASAALLGTATTAMLIGHSYLIAPAMSLTPLLRLLKAFGICLLARAIMAGLGLWFWTAQSQSSTLETEMLVWLPARWLVGVIVPVVLGWMAWETAKIRSTQSATGILYVLVIVCFLGELTSQLLLDKTGYIL